MPFAVGDVVVLVSGGPPMVVIAVEPSGNVDTRWFSSRVTTSTGQFQPKILVLVSAAAEGTVWPPPAG